MDGQVGRWIAKYGDGWLSQGDGLLATAALWVRIQTSVKNTKRETYGKDWPTHSSPPKKNIQKEYLQEGGDGVDAGAG